MLYKKNGEKSLSKELFQNPTCEYRSTPFWAWNSALEKDEMNRQIDIFKQMGFGGFHMHVRTGLKTEYLSDEFMGLIRNCVDKAKNEKMLAWLYDEDRWPSGAAGGLVTKDDKYKARNLLFTPFKDKAERDAHGVKGQRAENWDLLACYDIVLDENGYLKSYKKINENDEVEGVKWYAYREIYCTSPWYNNQTYVDTLSKEAIDRFIEVTHEKYKEVCGDEFGETVPAIFTDEPEFTCKSTLDNSFDKMDIVMPWTDTLPELYEKHYGVSVFDTLPEVFWELPENKISVHRYRFHDFTTEMFVNAFADNIGSWCDKNGIALTGHMMEESTLRGQSNEVGEAMRSYRGFGIPGIDMLCNWHEFSTAKQAQSAVHQYGREGMLSELYGVTAWDCDFRTYKHQGDWQAALGVTVRVPHLSWYAMGGEAKRDYPASIHYQSPWFEKYHLVEDHFARVNTALTRGKPIVKVAVVHPIESYWIHSGAKDKTAVACENLDEKFANVINWLLTGSIDFDFVSEALLPELCQKASNPLKVGEMEYDAVVVPGCETLRSSTIERLSDFRDKGGRLIFMGDAPYLCDAEPSDEGKKLFDRSEKVDFTKASLLEALENDRAVTIRYANGRLTDNLCYQLRQDNDCRWLFVCHTSEPENKDIDYGRDISITVAGEFAAELYDTSNGEIKPITTAYRNGNTVISYRIYSYESLLIKLTEGKNEQTVARGIDHKEGKPVASVVDYSLSGDNVLLLDTAEYKLSGDSDFSECEEILRLDNALRRELGLGKRCHDVVQPWVVAAAQPVDTLTLKFKFNSDIEFSDACLAFEDPEKLQKIIFNGKELEKKICGNYVDIAIFKLELPKIIKGENTLEMTYIYGENTSIENVLVLGKFGVKLIGTQKTIVPLPEKLGFGDITSQGLPFYGDNITYKFKATSKNGKMDICASWYRGAAISVRVDGIEKGDIIYPPYILSVDGLSDGEHDVEMTLYTHRYNTFGPVHLVEENCKWHGPNAWRSDRDGWCYEYVLRRVGILAAPKINN